MGERETKIALRFKTSPLISQNLAFDFVSLQFSLIFKRREKREI